MPDQSVACGDCVCQPGFEETGVDTFGRRICAPPTGLMAALLCIAPLCQVFVVAFARMCRVGVWSGAVGSNSSRLYIRRASCIDCNAMEWWMGVQLFIYGVGAEM